MQVSKLLKNTLCLTSVRCTHAYGTEEWQTWQVWAAHHRFLCQLSSDTHGRHRQKRWAVGQARGLELQLDWPALEGFTPEGKARRDGALWLVLCMCIIYTAALSVTTLTVRVLSFERPCQSLTCKLVLRKCLNNYLRLLQSDGELFISSSTTYLTKCITPTQALWIHHFSILIPQGKSNFIVKYHKGKITVWMQRMVSTNSILVRSFSSENNPR